MSDLREMRVPFTVTVPRDIKIGRKVGRAGSYPAAGYVELSPADALLIDKGLVTEEELVGAYRSAIEAGSEQVYFHY